MLRLNHLVLLIAATIIAVVQCQDDDDSPSFPGALGLPAFIPLQVIDILSIETNADKVAPLVRITYPVFPRTLPTDPPTSEEPTTIQTTPPWYKPRDKTAGRRLTIAALSIAVIGTVAAIGVTLAAFYCQGFSYANSTLFQVLLPIFLVSLITMLAFAVYNVVKTD